MNQKEKLLTLMEASGVDAMLLYSPDNRYWFSRFPSSLGYIIITKEATKLYLDGRYITAARTKFAAGQLTNIDEVVEFKQWFLSTINDELVQAGIKTLGFESDWVYFKEYEGFKKAFNGVELKPVNTDKLREVKDDWEVAQIKKACDISAEVFDDVLQFVKPGITEIELARFVSDAFLAHGAQKLSFDTIVASGVNGSMPHAVPTDKVINAGELVTLDMGCYYNGYCSDQTRTFAVGEITNPELTKIYHIVIEAQQRGIDALKPGVISGDIHQICFDYIEAQGYGQYFTHGTGHGIGTQIHEEPYNAAKHQTVLEAGMCVTVEPGIYVPGLGGVRIEDDILVTAKGHEFLTSAPRELKFVK
jgi:Xaa-Pro aminopeptidase